VIVENATGRVIGYTYLERAHWGGTTNREVKALMIAHAFRFARTVWFHVSPGNARSQRALEKIGARFDREEMVPVGGAPSARMIYRVDRG
jgi:RimJ/RimL family protein N-acetyltransferase